MQAGSRPRPGPRPRAANRRSAHGSTKRRVATERPLARPRVRERQQEPRRVQRRRGEPRRVERRREERDHAEQRPTREVREPRQPIDRARNRRWWLGVGVLGIGAFVFAIFEAPAFEAASAQISGHSRTSVGTIDAALAIPDDQALITYDTDEAADRVRELPWVEQASVVRQWPSTVRVVIREHAVVAGVGDAAGQRWMIVGEERFAIEERFTPPANVPLIVVDNSIYDAAILGEPIAGIERAYGLATDIPNQLDPWVSMWSVDEGGSVTANLTGSATATFGPAGEARTQFVSLASILGGGTSLSCIDVIDLSTPDTPVIHRGSSCITASRALGS